jgi:hypothetical protein
VENLGNGGYFNEIEIAGKIQLCYLRGNTPSKSIHVTMLLASVFEARGFIFFPVYQLVLIDTCCDFTHSPQ